MGNLNRGLRETAISWLRLTAIMLFGDIAAQSSQAAQFNLKATRAPTYQPEKSQGEIR
jgi:hypothetical protein